EWAENGEGERSRLEYDRAGAVTAVVDPAGYRTRIRRETAGRRTETTLVPGAPPEVRRFDEAGRLIELTDPAGSTWRTEYDTAGRIRREVAPDGTETVYTYRYLSPGVEVTRTDPLGNDWILQFDASGRRTGAVDPSGAATTFVRDAAGRITSVIDAHGYRRDYAYDAHGNVLAQTDAYGNRRVFTYDSLGNATSLTLPTGETTRFGHDALGRRLWTEDPLGNRTRFTYDAVGNLLETETPTGLIRRFAYDAAGRTVARVEPDGATYRYEYDRRGRLSAEVDPTGGIRRYEYEENARAGVTAEINRLGGRRTLSYGATGRIDSITDFNGVRHDFDYDPLGRLIREVAEGAVVRAFEYDARGAVVRAVGPEAVLDFEYDGRGLLVETRDREAEIAVSYDHDAAGRRTRLLMEGYEIETTYGNMGEIREVTFRDASAFGGGQGRVALEYDESLRERSRRFSDNLIAERHYDEAGRPAGVVHRRGGSAAGAVLDAEAYVYDRDGRRIYTVDEAGALSAYRYDSAGRLEAAFYPYDQGVVESHLRHLKATGLVPPVAEADQIGRTGPPALREGITLSLKEAEMLQEVMDQVLPRRKHGPDHAQGVWGESFTYDERGNLTEMATPLGAIDFAYDEADRQVRAGAVSAAYDAAGNVTRRSIGSAVLEYEYDVRHRMTRVAGVTPDGREVEVRYGYDAFGRRTFRHEVPVDAGQAPSSAAEALARTVYQGLSFLPLAVLEGGAVTGAVREGGAAPKPRRGAGLRSRVESDHGSAFPSRLQIAALAVAVGESPAAVVGSDQVTYLGVDVLGSVTVRVTGGARGGAGEDLEYRAFGAVRAGAVRGALSFGYTGKILDAAAAVYDYGLRDYAPSAHRFTTVDPLRAGANWYAYVHNNPVNLIDRLGLEASIPSNFPLDSSVQVFRSDGNIDQLAFDQRYGFGLDTGTQSCQSVAVCNLYAQETVGGMTVEQLDVVVSVSVTAGYLEDEGGSVTDFSGLSRTIATQLDRDDYYEYIYPAPEYERLTMTEEDFNQSNAVAGVVRLDNQTLQTTHFVTQVDADVYDPLPVDRAAAPGYEVVEVRPLQLLGLNPGF
ncbi:MAG: RHS repeat-associated core domain-containing protein, partial [Spirochaetota bacterium]